MANTFSFQFDDAGIARETIQDTAGRLDDYLRRLRRTTEQGGYEQPESSINLPSDAAMRSDVAETVDAIATDNLECVVVVGIGGSNLGTVAVYEAIRGNLSHLSRTEHPRLLFADTVDPESLNDICSVLTGLDSKDQFLVNVVTKSGSTTETISNFEYILHTLRETFDRPEERIVATTDEGSRLWEVARAEGIPHLQIPSNVGGRFSVLSPVGQFPLELTDIDVDRLLQGAGEMRDRCLTSDIDDNPALTTAALLYLHDQRDVDIHNSFFFNPQMESVGKWYRQLLGESIGKQFDNTGRQVRTGITPLISIGSTDLHSMAQLYFGGPRDKFTTLVYAATRRPDMQVPKAPLMGKHIAGLAGKEIRSIMTAIYEGVRATYQNDDLPFAEIRLDDLSTYSIGGFLQYEMMSIMMLAELLNVNAFDQPNVEGYKEETRKRL